MMPKRAVIRLAFALFCALCVAGQARAKDMSEQLKALQAQYTDLYREGAYERGLAAAEKALALGIKEFGAEDEQISILAQSVGILAEAAGNLPLAEAKYKQAVRIGEKIYGADSAAVSMTLDKLAGIVLASGRLDEAQALYERVLKIREDILPNHAYSASAHAGLGDVKRTRGDFAGALPHYRKAIALLTGQKTEQAVAQSVLESEIKRHRDIFIGLSRASFGLRGAAGSNPAALMNETYAAGQQAWATAVAAALAKMTTRLRAGDTEMGRAIRQLQELSDRVLALHEDDIQALATWSQVQHADAEYSDLLSQFRAMSIEQGKVNAPLGKRQTALIARLQAEMAKCPPGQDKPGCEASKREIEAISKELQALNAETSKGSAAFMALHGRMQAAEQRLPGYAEFTARRNATLSESQGLEARLKKQRTDVVAAFPQYLAFTEPAPLSVQETQSLLRQDEALVSILVGSQKSIVWAVTREGADWAEISVGEKVLAEHVSALRLGLDPLAPGVSDSLAATVAGSFDLLRAHVVYKLLLEPLKPLLAGKQHLLLVPTGPLTSLPFQVLLTEPPRTDAAPADAFRDASWLIRRHALSVLPSVESLRSLRKFATDGLAVKPFFGLGDPVLLGPGGQRKRGAAPPLFRLYRNGVPDLRALQQLTPLPETAQELESIAKILGASRDALSLREAATETRLKSVPLKDYRILQFATHGLVAGDLSGLAEPALVLTPPAKATEEDDGLLTASEIAGLVLDADWVVLSACNTAAGDKVGADALSGLARAFFFAGARAMLVSHWSVYSQAAVELTTRTFRNLAKSPEIGRAEAFRKAMLTLIDEGRPPSYWAPFVVVGEGGPARRKP